MKLLPSVFSTVYSRAKLFVFAGNSRGRYSIFMCFIYGLEENNSKSEVIFAVCRKRHALTSLLQTSPFSSLKVRKGPPWISKLLGSPHQGVSTFPKSQLISNRQPYTFYPFLHLRRESDVLP